MPGVLPSLLIIFIPEHAQGQNSTFHILLFNMRKRRKISIEKLGV